MPELTDLSQDAAPERALLLAIDTGEYDVNTSLAELAELAATAGAETLATLTQKRPAPDAATCMGSGRLQEAALYVQNLEIDLAIFDRELSGSQTANIEKLLGCRVIDRTTLILDIFAQRAHTAEGRLQVELAQQKYRLPRLGGRGVELSRLGGGIGTRGPGETKLESDRRHIRRRITALEEELAELRRRRELLRTRRKKDNVITAAIVGYTNVGKSTLLNALTNAGVLVENKLFATLDPTARGLTLPDGREVMLVDTVGLVRRLPHMLVEAFRSTLEEAANADLLLHVCDISDPEAREQMAVTTELLGEIGAGEIPMLHVLNKADQIETMPVTLGRDTCLISAKTGFGLEELLVRVGELLPPTQTRMQLLLPYAAGALAGELRSYGTVFTEEYRADGIFLDLLVDHRLAHKVADYHVAP